MRRWRMHQRRSSSRPDGGRWAGRTWRTRARASARGSEGVGSGSLKVNGEIIVREPYVDDSSLEKARGLGDEFGPSGRTIWTIGHSTRSFEEFLALLEEHRIRFLADVR